MKLQTPKGFRVAVFIDAANFEISLKTSNLTADYKKLIKFVEQRGEIVALRYYSPQFNTVGQNKFFSLIKNLGFKLVTKNIKVIRNSKTKSQNKANFDVEIAFDAAVRMNQFNKLILFSGDSDFVYLVKELQKRNIYTIVISPQWRTAKELRKQADEFIDLRECEFAIKKPPKGGAHNNLSTASTIYQKMKKKSR